MVATTTTAVTTTTTAAVTAALVVTVSTTTPTATTTASATPTATTTSTTTATTTTTTVATTTTTAAVATTTTATTATTTTTTGASGTTAGLPSPWEQADVYAFGVVVWALRFCERPWHECRSPYEIVRRVGMEGGRLPLDGVGADGAGVRGALRAVLAACLSPKPEQRPSFAALLTSLQQVPPEEWAAE